MKIEINMQIFRYALLPNYLLNLALFTGREGGQLAQQNQSNYWHERDSQG